MSVTKDDAMDFNFETIPKGKKKKGIQLWENLSTAKTLWFIWIEVFEEKQLSFSFY